MRPALIGILGIAVAFTASSAQDKDKDRPRTALPPHPLDSVFERRTENDCRNAMINNALYNRAFKEALKAKREAEEQSRRDPSLRSSTPAQAARQRFLEVLNAAGEPMDKVGKDKKFPMDRPKEKKEPIDKGKDKKDPMDKVGKDKTAEKRTDKGSTADALAKYRAEQKAKKVTLFAEGNNPSGGWKNQLDVLPIDIYPPEFRFTQTKPAGPAIQVITPFSVQATAHAPTAIDHVFVTDAIAKHRVAVKQVP
jgi:hypothetical protein